jgi:hypothetical protein
MPWYSPMSWFSRTQAMNAKNNANTAILKSALTNYINATKNMNANATRKALNNTRIGLTETYKNRIANAVANAVIAAKKANVAMAAMNNGAVSETAAAKAVTFASTNVNKLNMYMKNLGNLTTNAAVNLYIKGGRNIQSNRNTNKSRPVPPGINGPTPLYKNFFNRVNSRGKSNLNYQKLLNNVRGVPANATNALINATASRIVKNYKSNNVKALINNKNSFEGQMRKIINSIEGRMPRPTPAKVGPLLAAQTQRQVKAPKYNKNTATQTLLNANVKALSLNNRANLIKAINSKLASTNTKPENKTKLTNKRKNISSIGGTNASFLNVSPELPANNPNTPGLVLKSNKGQVGGVARNVYYVNGSPNRYIKNTNGKYIKLSNGNVNLGTWPAPNANARKVIFDPENGFIQTNTKN